jgi:putative hydrolase of the HAD superfamily
VTRLRAVLFDLDDTLVDQASAARAASVEWGRTHGLVGSDEELAASWSAIATPHYQRYQLRELTFAEQRRARVREFLPHLDLTADTVADDLFRGYLDLYEAGWSCFPDAVPTLRRVREAGLLAAVLTNGERAHQQLKLDLVGLDREVDAMFSSDQFPRGKPDPRVFLGTCSALGVEPGESLMVGNSVTHDLQGGLAAGLEAVLLDRHDDHPEHAPRIRSLDELDLSLVS